MKPTFAKILNDINRQAFSIKHYSNTNFATEFHYHPECQINLVLESTGKRIIGDNIDSYEKDEITFLGSNLPHVWYTHADDFPDSIVARSITLFFDPEKLLAVMRNFIDTRRLHSFLQISKQGILFEPLLAQRMKPLILDISNAEGLKQVVLFLDLMDLIINTNAYKVLNDTRYDIESLTNNYDKIDNIIRFMFQNYHRDISLDEVSVIGNMTKPAFCRYFKNRTQKSFTQFLNEIRISYSCKMINESNELIGNIAYACGFSSLSNFNKTFKSIKKTTPTDYKNKLSIIRNTK
ncbi:MULTISPECIES: AraC family transcriptional regulator [Sphingobacterium]|uniref:AraC family transcriptional regulator n=1 Tax=Sphingobacterium TaxID=28453 RepID=UPI0013DAFAA1|nr:MULTISPECIES: AraC family transcriptional regulator [unclassified Sphingobacterium]